jgi:hypothetical protein
MTQIENGRSPERANRPVKPSLGPQELRALRIALSAGIHMDVNTSGGPVKLDWEQIAEVGKRGVTSSLPKPYGE